MQCARQIPRLAAAALVAGAVVALAAPAARAQDQAPVPCGQTPPGKTAPAVGALTFDTEQSRVDLDFKDGTDPDTFNLVFKVAGCSLDSADGVSVRVRAPGGAGRAIGAPMPSAKGTLLLVDIPVTDPSKFDTGEVKPLITVSGAPVDEAVMRVSMKRKEPLLPGPAAIAAVAWLGGFAAALLTTLLAIPKRDLHFGWIVVAFFGSLVAAWLPFKVGYLDVATWSLDAGSVGALLLAIAAAAAGGATTGRWARASPHRSRNAVADAARPSPPSRPTRPPSPGLPRRRPSVEPDDTQLEHSDAPRASYRARLPRVPGRTAIHLADRGMEPRRSGPCAIAYRSYAAPMGLDGLNLGRGNEAPWLLDLATPQEDSGPAPGRPVYDDTRQITYLQDPTHEPAIDSDIGTVTKKADRETGEDQKGF